MRSFRVFFISSVCCAAHALSLSAYAQQGNASSKDAPPPPRLEKLEEGEQPAVTVRPPSDKATITEKRAPGGKRTEVKVHTGKSTYNVQSSDQVGNSVSGDAQSINAKPAQWEILQFDLSKQKKVQQEPNNQAAVPPPPKVNDKEAPANPPTKK